MKTIIELLIILLLLFCATGCIYNNDFWHKDNRVIIKPILKPVHVDPVLYQYVEERLILAMKLKYEQDLIDKRDTLWMPEEEKKSEPKMKLEN